MRSRLARFNPNEIKVYNTKPFRPAGAVCVYSWHFEWETMPFLGRINIIPIVLEISYTCE